MVGHHDVHFRRHHWMMSLAMDYVYVNRSISSSKDIVYLRDYTISMLRLNFFSVNCSLFLIIKIFHLHKIKINVFHPNSNNIQYLCEVSALHTH